MRTLGFIIFIFFTFLNFQTRAQSLSDEKCIWISTFNISFQPDSLSIITSTIDLKGVETHLYEIEYSLATGKLMLKMQNPPDSVLMCYKTLGVSFHQPVFLRNPHEYDSNALFFNTPAFQKLTVLPREEFFATESIRKSGSLSRGISLGNTQNIFVNSNFNLQMEGKLTDDLNIRAAITDQNIPYQPEGNSQRVQDFDNVFVQVYNEKLSLMAGDVVLQHKPSYYLRYYKNVQGAYGTYQMTNRFGKSETTIGASVAKGKFASIQLEIQEGISGPYRLRGAENERFIIVLANSEKVFLDGRQLQRGFDFDYVIDYNTGEITFSNSVLITKFSRVRVDFEYSIQNYARSIFTANHYQEGEKLDLFVNYYQEKDNRNRPLFYDLNDADKQVLSNVGDNLNNALASGIDSVGFEPDRILYAKKDTVDVDGNPISSVFEYSENQELAVFQLSFTELGQGQGNYILGSNTLNGRVYEWVSPINGVAQGSFEPAILLVAPSKKQMVNLGAKYKFSKNDFLMAEVAYADQDLNLYSDIDASDDRGKAYMMQYGKNGISIGSRQLSATMKAEILEQHFRPIDRFRSIDFDRDWNMPLNYAASKEQIYLLQTNLKKDASHQWSYELVRRDRGTQLRGWQHQFKLHEAFGQWHNVLEVNSLTAQQSSFDTHWNRLSAETFWKASKWIPGYQFNLDRNENYKSGEDSLINIPNAFYFYENKFFIRNGDSIQGNFLIDYSIRKDKRPIGGVMTDSDQAQTFNLAWQSNASDKSSWSTQFTYRTLSNLLDSSNAKEETLMGRFEWAWQPIPRVFRSDFTYAIANGRELKREYAYFQVATGEGTHTWVDQNDNGVQELNEFYEAITFDQKNYVKVFTPTDQYLAAYSQIFNYRFSIDAPVSWRTEGGFLRFLSRFSNTSFWNLDKKMTDNRLLPRFSPFYQLADSSLISNRSYFKTTTFVNKSNPNWGGDFTYSKNGFKQLLNAGFESRNVEEYRFNYRINISNEWAARLAGGRSIKESKSDFLSGRNYILLHHLISPELSWQPKPDFRLSGAYSWSEKLNRIGLEESAVFSEYIMEARWAKASQTNLNGRLKLSNITFTGSENNAVAFEMLEALRPGRNVSWSFNWLQRLSNGLQLTLSYEGRKSPDVSIINIGRAQLTLLF